MEISNIKSKDDVLKYFLENWEINSLIAIKKIIDNVDDIYMLLTNYDRLSKISKTIKEFNKGNYDGYNYEIRSYEYENMIAVNVKRHNDFIDDKRIFEAIDSDLPDVLKDEFIEWLDNNEDIWPQFIEIIREDLLNILQNPKEFYNEDSPYYEAIYKTIVSERDIMFLGRSGGWLCMPLSLFEYDTIDFNNFDITIQEKNIDGFLDEIENGEHVSTIIEDMKNALYSIELIDKLAEFVKKYNKEQNFTDYIINNIDWYLEMFKDNLDEDILENIEIYKKAV